MAEWTTTITFALGCVAALLIWQRLAVKSQAHPLPPGPPGLPWIGNVIGINVTAPWITYAEWSRTYGDLVYSRLLGKDVIIISSERIARDLFENRSKNYSDRPIFHTSEFCGLGFNSALLPYGDRWRLHRRFFHQTFRLKATSRFVPYQNTKACLLLRRLLNAPEHLNDHVFEYTTSIILNSAFNYDPASQKDELVDIMAQVLDIYMPILRPDIAVIVGAFPFLLYLPTWLPGMSFKKKMLEARKFSKQYLDRPFQHSLKSEPNNSTAPSMVQDALQNVLGKGISPEQSWMQALKEASGSAFMVASETSNSVLMTFFLVMMLNPTVQKKAQAQIDEVVGNTRLPMIEDRPSLPFIDAILWELFRCYHISPLSAPHLAVEDDVYDGFHIPKGAVILTNIWAMAHDESKYPSPHTFIPERFLNDDSTLKPNDIINVVFGFGRRMCVGRHFADTSVWSAMVKVLAMFKILKPLDDNGMEITVEPKFSTGIAIHPLPFPYRIVPRFPDMTPERLEKLVAANTTDV